MSKTLKWLVGVAVVGGAVLASSAYRYEEIKPGTTASAFTGTATDGKSYSLSSLVKNGAVQLYFIKIGCPVNHRAAPFVVKLDNAYQQKGQIIGVINGSMSEARKWAKDYGAKFPIIADPDMKIIRAYKADHSPWFVSVGKGGKVVKSIDDASSTQLSWLNKTVAASLGTSAAKVTFDGAPTGGG